MFKEIKLSIFIISGMYISARVDNNLYNIYNAKRLMPYFFFVFKAAPLNAINTLSELDYKCMINENIIYFYWIMNFVLRMLHMKMLFHSSLPYNDDNTINDKLNFMDLVNCSVELIIDMLPFFLHLNYIIIANILIRSIRFIMLDRYGFASVAAHLCIRCVIITILQHWNFSETVQVLCALLAYMYFFVELFTSNYSEISPNKNGQYTIELRYYVIFTYIAKPLFSLIAYIVCRDIPLVLFIFA